jgi:hypothetical protein
VDLEQYHIVKFLRNKGLKNGEIAKELSNEYDPDTSTPPSIECWLHQINLGRTDLQTQHAGGRPVLHDTDAKVLSFLRKYPFSSVRTIAEPMKIHASIIHSHLVENLSIKILFVRWVLHPLTSKLRQKRVELSSQ